MSSGGSRADGATVGTRQGFLAQQAAALAPLDLVIVTLSTEPPVVVEISRDKDGPFRVRAASPKQPFAAEATTALKALGLTNAEELWESRPLDDAAAASGLAEQVLTDVFHADDAAAVDVDHGSRRPIVEAQERLAAMRTRIAPILADVAGAPAVVDRDGDFALKMDGGDVYVSPMAQPSMLPVVRVFAITNVGVNLAPELGLFLSRLNFTLLFGRFALDTDHRAVWFSETLLGEAFTDEELRFTVRMVAETADEWDDRIGQMFGGTARSAQPEDQQPVPPKPGAPPGGYL